MPQLYRKEADPHYAGDLRKGSANTLNSQLGIYNPKIHQIPLLRVADKDEKVFCTHTVDLLIKALDNSKTSPQEINDAFASILKATLTEIYKSYRDKIHSNLSPNLRIASADGRILFRNTYHLLVTRANILQGSSCESGVSLLINISDHLIKTKQIRNVCRTQLSPYERKVIHKSNINARSCDIISKFATDERRRLQELWPKDKLIPLKLSISDANCVKAEACRLRGLMEEIYGSLEIESDLVVANQIASLSFCLPGFFRIKKGTDSLDELGNLIPPLDQKDKNPQVRAVRFIREIWLGSYRKDSIPRGLTGEDPIDNSLRSLLLPQQTLETKQNIYCPALDRLCALSKYDKLYHSQIEVCFEDVLRETLTEVYKKYRGNVYAQIAPELSLTCADGRVVFKNVCELLKCRAVFNLHYHSEAGLPLLFRITEELILNGKIEGVNKDLELSPNGRKIYSRANWIARNCDLTSHLIGYNNRALLKRWPENIEVKFKIPGHYLNQFKAACVTLHSIILDTFGALSTCSDEEASKTIASINYCNLNYLNSTESGEEVLKRIASYLPADKINKNDSYAAAITFVRDLWSAPQKTKTESLIPKNYVAPEDEVNALIAERLVLRRYPLPEEQVFYINASQFNKLKVVGWAEFIRIQNINYGYGDDEFVKQCISKYQEENWMPVRRALIQILISCLYRMQVKDETIRTYDLPNIALADKEGKILFNNFGHFLAYIARMEKTLAWQATMVGLTACRHRLSADKLGVRRYDPIPLLAQIRDESSDHHFKELLKLYPTKEWPTLHLRSMEPNSTYICPWRVPAQVLRTAYDKTALTKAFTRGYEAIVQVMGSIKLGTVKEVNDIIYNMYFGDSSGGETVSGYDLMMQIGALVPGTQKKPSPSQGIRLIREWCSVYKEDQLAIKSILKFPWDYDLSYNERDSQLVVQDNEANEATTKNDQSDTGKDQTTIKSIDVAPPVIEEKSESKITVSKNIQVENYQKPKDSINKILTEVLLQAYEPSNSDNICRISMAKFHALKPCGRVEFIAQNDLEKGDLPQIKKYIEKYEAEIWTPIREAFAEIILSFLNQQEISNDEIRSCGYWNTKLVDENGKVIFTNFGHLLGVFGRLEKALRFEAHWIREQLANEKVSAQYPRLSYGEREWPEELAFQTWNPLSYVAFLRDQFSNNKNSKFLDRLHTRHHELGCPMLHIRALSSTSELALYPFDNQFVLSSSDPKAFLKALNAAYEAVIQTVGDLNIGTTLELNEIIRSINFGDFEGKIIKSGSEIFKEVSLYSPFHKQRALPQQGINAFREACKVTQDSIVSINALLEKPWNFSAGAFELPIQTTVGDSETTENSIQVNLIKSAILDSHITKLKASSREAQSDENTSSLPSVDKLLSLTLYDPASVIENKIRTKNRSLETEFNLAHETFYNSIESVLISILSEFLSEKSVGARKIFSYEWPEERLSNSEGLVVFENLGHFLAFTGLLHQDLTRAALMLRDDYFSRKQKNDQTLPEFAAPEQLLTLAQLKFDSSPILLNRLHKIDSIRPQLHLRSLDKSCLDSFPQPNAAILQNSSKPHVLRHFLIIGYEALIQMMGSLETGSTESALKSFQTFTFAGKNIELAGEGDLSILTTILNLSNLSEGKKRNKENAITLIREAFKTPDEVKIIQHIPHKLAIPSAPLFLALCALNHSENTAAKFSQFEKMRGTLKPISKDQNDKTTNPVRAFRSFVEKAIDSYGTIDTSDIALHYLTELMHQLCLRSYNGELSKIAEELKQYNLGDTVNTRTSRGEIVEKILEHVIPTLEARYRRIANCKVPETIAIIPFSHQRDAAIEAAYGERPILVMEPGIGKTLSLAMSVEMLGLSGALWVTKSSVRDQTLSELSGKVLNGKRVVLIGPAEKNLPTGEFISLLASADYIVTGYDTLRTLHQNAAGNFAALKNWASTRAYILDEAHLVDNRQSGRSQATLEIKAVKTLVASGTPYQHNHARVATLLSLALPNKFPNASALEKLFESDPGAARMTLHAHSTVMCLEDVSKFFEDPLITPFSRQLLSGIPCVPQLSTHRHRYKLSEEHSRVYVDLILNYERWSNENGLYKHKNDRATALRRLVSYPEQLNLSQPIAMIDAVKEIALPYLARGEKVLVLSSRKHALHLLEADPEFRSYGSLTLDGDISIRERTTRIKQIENDPSHQIALGQIAAVGSGFNIRSISCIIVIDRPWQSSELYQALRRPVRLLGKGDEQFARQTVNAYFLEATLDPSVLATLSTEARKALGQETIYHHLLSRSLAELERFRSYLVRGEDGETATQSLQMVLDRIENLHREANIRINSSLLSSNFSRLNKPIGIYNSPAKNNWRTKELGGFVDAHIKNLSRPIEEIQVALLAGPEGLEIPIYLQRGVLPENIHVFEGSPNPEWRAIVRDMANTFGVRFYASSVERLLPFMENRFDIISIDPDGYTTAALARMFALLPINDSALVLKNSLACRERGEAKQMVIESAYRRELLDLHLVKLIGTQSNRQYDSISAVALIKESSRIRAASRALTEMISPILKKPASLVADFLSELALGSPHTEALKQGSYVTPGGSPFHYTFSKISKWDSIYLESHLAQGLKELVAQHAQQNTIGSRINTPTIRAELVSEIALIGPELFAYFEGKASQSGRFEEVEAKVGLPAWNA